MLKHNQQNNSLTISLIPTNIYKVLLFLIVTIKLFNFTSAQKANKPRHRDLTNIIYITPGARLSNFVKEFQKENPAIEDKRNVKEKSFNYNNILHLVQNKHDYIVNLPRYLNSSIPAHDFYLNYIKKNKEELKELDNYAYNISYSDKLISKFPKPIVRYPKTNKNGNNGNNKELINKLDLEFKLAQPDILPQFKSEYFFNISNLVAINNIMLGTCSDNNLQLYRFFHMSLEELNITDFFVNKNNEFNISNKKVIKILLDSNAQKQERYILFVDDLYNVYIYKVVFQLSGSYEYYYPTFSPIMLLSDAKFKQTNIVDFVQKDNTFFIALENDGILVVSSSKDNNNNNNNKKYKIEYEIKSFSSSKATGNNISNSTANDNTEQMLKIKDIQLIDNSIYVLIKDFGLKILNVKDIEKIRFEAFEFRHPYIEKIEIHSNPNYQSFYFLGVLISNRLFTEGDEFFLEFDLENEFEPKLNRVYLYDKVISVANILNDEYFTYIFEKNSNKFLVISRSSTANEYNSIFELHVEELIGQSIIAEPFIFTDELKEFRHVGIINENNKFIYTRNVELTSSAIEFYFWESANYEVSLHTYTDYCGESLVSTKMCKIEVKFTLDVSLLPQQLLKIQEEYLFYVVVFFLVYNLLCFIAYRMKYAGVYNDFAELENEKTDYQENGERISARSVDGKKQSSDQVIEMHFDQSN